MQSQAKITRHRGVVLLSLLSLLSMLGLAQQLQVQGIQELSIELVCQPPAASTVLLNLLSNSQMCTTLAMRCVGPLGTMLDHQVLWDLRMGKQHLKQLHLALGLPSDPHGQLLDSSGKVGSTRLLMTPLLSQLAIAFAQAFGHGIDTTLSY